MLGEFSLKYKKVIFAFWLLVFFFFSAVLCLRIFWGESLIDNSVGVWFMQDDAELKTYKQYNKDFGEQEWSSLLIETVNIYDPVFLNELQQITKKIENLKHVVKVISITNVKGAAIKKNGSLNFKKIYSVSRDGEPMTRAELQAFREKLKQNPLFHNQLFNINDFKHTMLLIKNDNFVYAKEPYRIKLIKSIKKIIKKSKTVKSFSLAGTTIVNAELNKTALRDMYVFYTLITFMLILFGWFTLKNVKDILVLFAVVVSSIIPTMGLIALMRIPYNMVTIMLPIVLISLAVADVIHIINEFHLLRLQYSTEESVVRSIKSLWKPGIWTSVTTVLGFLSLSLSTVYPIFQIGIFASFGIVLAWLASVLIVPQLLVKFWSKNKIEQRKKRNNYPKKIVAIIENQSSLVMFLLLLIIIPVFGIYFIDVDTNYSKFFGSSADISQSYKKIEKAKFAQNPVTIVLSFPESIHHGAGQYYQLILKFESEIKKLPKVIKLLTITDLLKQMNKLINGTIINEKYSKNCNPPQIDQLLRAAELYTGDDFYDYINKEKTKAQLIAMTPYFSSSELDNFIKTIKMLKKRYLPEEIGLAITGTTVLWGNMDRQISKTQIHSLAAVFLFLLIFFPILFSSLKIGFLGVAINIIPLGFTLGIMSILNIKINMATALIGGVSLGIVVDNTLHLLFRINGFFKKGFTWKESVVNAVETVGHSIIMTSVILIGGFLCMTASNFLPSAHLGIFISLSIAIALFLDLFVLPILLLKLWVKIPQAKSRHSINRVTPNTS